MIYAIDTERSVKATLFDHDASCGVLEHHLQHLNERDQTILHGVIAAFQGKHSIEGSTLKEAREIFATFRADGRP